MVSKQFKTQVPGETFGSLTIQRLGGFDEKGKIIWKCECKCGEKLLVSSEQIEDTESHECFCPNTKSYQTLLSRWKGMKVRCSNPKSFAYRYYGSRGIGFCDEWKDFEMFYKWAMSSGYSKELQLDRRDNNKGYSPDNCRWVTSEQNNNNRRDTISVILNGEEKTLSEISKETGIKHKTLAHRYYLGDRGSKLVRPVVR